MKTTKLSHRIIISGLVNAFVLIAVVLSIAVVVMPDVGVALLKT